MGLRFFAILFVFIPLAYAEANKPEPKVVRESAARCKAQFDEILKDTDEDLALVPYVQRALQEIYAVLNAPHLEGEAFVKNLVDADIRKFAFQLEAMSKALRSVDEEAYGLFHLEAMNLENGIGDYVFETELLEHLQESPRLKALLTSEVETLLQGRITGARDRLLRDLRRAGWTEKNDAYGRILGILEDSKPVTKKSMIKKKVLHALSKNLRKTHSQLVDGKIDPKKIEEGAHELRRRIRETPITLWAFPGMFYLDEGLGVKGVKLSGEPLKEKYKLDTRNRLKRAVGISESGYRYLMEVMGTLGKLKANDGIKEFVGKALKDGKVGKSAEPLIRALSESGESAQSFKETQKKTAEIFKEVIESKILLQLADQFDDAAKEF